MRDACLRLLGLGGKSATKLLVKELEVFRCSTRPFSIAAECQYARRRRLYNAASASPRPKKESRSVRTFSTSTSLQKRTAGRQQTPGEPRIKIPFGAQSREALGRIFQQDGIGYEDGNKILRILHQRRVIGSLVDKGLAIAGNHNVKNESLQHALDWLREGYPVDEQEAAEIWAEQEAARLEGTYIAKAEKLGLYKPLDGTEKQELSTKSVYGVSVIDEFKKFHEERRAREAKEKLESGETQRNETMALAKREEREQKQMVMEQKWKERQERRALMGMVTPEDVPMPEMSTSRRLWPSTVFGVLLIGASWWVASVYEPMSKEYRLFPETPTAVATVVTLIAVNTAFWLVWKVPPLWQSLNKVMVQVASYPYWPSVVGNIFSHQSLPHLGANMVVLFGYGLTLHEDIGRGNFLALYLSGGIAGSLFSLWYHVLSRNLTFYTFGASGAVWATMLGWGVLNLSKPMAPSDSWLFAADASRWAVIVFQFLAHFAPGIQSRIDVYSHLGGALAGALAAWSLKKQALRRREEQERLEPVSLRDSPSAVVGLDGPKAA